MRIPQETIFAIQQAVQVEEVLRDFLSLQKKGKKYLCPFHQDTDPSFSITSDGKFYKCFSCQAKGNAVAYLMEHQKMSYPQAMHHLAQKYSIPWQVDEKGAEDIAYEKEQEALYILLEKAKDYYAAQLHTSRPPVAYNYLKQRQLADPVLLKKFSLGYSPPEWRSFYDFALKQGYHTALLEQAGLVLSKENEEKKKHTYDRFRGRLMFPIHDTKGNVIGFGGRALTEMDRHTPKYINSPETLVYQKSYVLYGLYQAKRAIQEQKNCYLVEGYTDVLAMHQAGIENVVSSGGTSLTQAQVALLRRFARQITLLFDGDVAGQTAALRSIDLLLSKGYEVKIVCLPPGEDPDSLRRDQGNQALQTYLKEHIQDFITFKSNALFQYAGGDPAKRTEAMTELLTTIAAIPDPLKRAFYIQSCSQTFNLSETLLQSKLEEILARQSTQQRHQIRPRPKAFQATAAKSLDLTPTLHLERTVLYMLLHHAMYTMEANQYLADYLFTELSDITFSSLSYQFLWDEFRAQWCTQGPMTSETFLSSQGAQLEKIAHQIMQKPQRPSKQWKTKHNIMIPREEDNLLFNIVRDVQRLKRAHITQAITKNLALLEQATTKEEREKYFSQNIQLTRDQNQIAKKLSTVVLN